MSRSLALTLNALALYALAAVLLIGFAMQFALRELPSPLCMLQRAFFCALAIGPILNLRHGPQPAHYSLSMLAAIGGAAVSARQMLLHILPGDPGYGTAILGYHYYTWAFLLFVAAMVLIMIMLLFEQQFAPGKMPRIATSSLVAICLAIALTAANAVSTFAICGPTACPDNPLRYELFHRL